MIEILRSRIIIFVLVAIFTIQNYDRIEIILYSFNARYKPTFESSSYNIVITLAFFLRIRNHFVLFI